MHGEDGSGAPPPVLRDAGEADDGVYVVGVRESTDPEAWSLLFMECGPEDEHEVDLGWDTYCLVVDPGQATFYGGIVDCEVTATELSLVFTEDAASTLGMPMRARFVLDLPDGKREMLGRGLRRVLTSGRADAVPHLRFA